MSDWASTVAPGGGQGHDVDFTRGPSGKRDLKLVRGTQAIADRITHRLRTFTGECRFDRLAGVPYLQILFVKGTTGATWQAVLEQHINATRGVARVLELQLYPDFARRVLRGTAQILPVGAVDPLTIQIP